MAAARGRGDRRREAGEGGGDGTRTPRSTTGKVAAALYYARTVLPGVEQKAKAMAEEDRSPLDMPDAAFATV